MAVLEAVFAYKFPYTALPNLGRGIAPPQWVRGIYRPNIQDTVITVIGLYGIGLGLLLYVASWRFGG